MRDNFFKILIVDDSQEWISFHKNILLGLYTNIQITETYSAKEGLNKALTDQFDVIISDMEMEEILNERYAGMWLIRQLKQRPKIKANSIIAVSSAYDIQNIANSLGVSCILKQDLYNNPLLFKYKIDEILG